MSLKSKVRNGSQKTAHLDCIGHTYKAKVLSTHVQPMYLFWPSENRKSWAFMMYLGVQKGNIDSV